MERTPRLRRDTPGAFTSEAVAALRGVAASGRPPILLGYHPHFTTNPYQALLYGRSREHGIAPVAVDTVEQLEELTALRRRGIETVLHLHWLHEILRDAESEADADHRARTFLEIVDEHQGAGGRLVWTVHNILPHGAARESAEARLSAAIADRADVVHVLAATTPRLVAPYFELPTDRILHVPHASYLGAYEDHVTRLDARHELGLLPDEFVFAVVGAIRPYKGLTELLDAWQSATAVAPRRLVIAGQPSDEPGVQDLIERAALDPTVLVDARKIPAPEMQLFLRAADVAILPYLRSLNSGALALALTFGLPVIVPAGGGLAEVVDEGFARTVRPGDPADLRRAIEAAPSWVRPAASAAARARAEELAPSIVAERFAVGLRDALDSVREPRRAPAARQVRLPAHTPEGGIGQVVAHPPTTRHRGARTPRPGGPIAAGAGRSAPEP
ncbi:MAG TPA: glycosyltransferase [Candidatus Limnocylindrales bacterium]